MINPKHEIRNAKQIQSTNEGKFKTNEFWYFEFGICLGFRA